MPTPTTAFAEIAAKYGDVDPEDIGAVQSWFEKELGALPPETIEQIFHDLLARDGDPEAREIVPAYPNRAPLPSLGASPSLAAPPMADTWKRLVRRLLGMREP
jgi:hypothetical protein